MKTSQGYLLDGFVVEDIEENNNNTNNTSSGESIDNNTNDIEDNLIKKTKKKRIIKKKSLNICDSNQKFNSANKIIENMNYEEYFHNIKSNENTTSNLFNNNNNIANIPLITLNSVREIRAFNNPSIVIKNILKSICMLLGEEDDLTWKNIQKIISSSMFINKIKYFDYKTLDSKLRRKISNFIKERSSSFDFDIVNKVSIAISPFIPYIKANLKYSLIFEKLENNNVKQKKIPKAKIIKSDDIKNNASTDIIDIKQTELELLLNNIKISCSKLSKADFNECRSFINPPLNIINVFKAVVRLLGEKDLSWNNIKKIITNYSFFNDFNNFDIRKININIRKKVSKYVKLNYESFEEEYIRSTSLAVVPFVSWVKANLKYHIKYYSSILNDKKKIKKKKL